MRARAILALAFALGACNALTGLSDDYRLATGADGSPPEGIESGAAEAGPSVPTDGGSEAAPGSFCAQWPNSAFCTDFEDQGLTAPNFGWDEKERNGGDFAIEPGVGKDGSRGMRFRATADGGASLKVAIWKNVPGTSPSTSKRYDLRFDFRIAESTMEYAALATFAFPQQAGLATFGLGWYGDYLDTTSPPQPGDTNRLNASPGPWHTGRVLLAKDANTQLWALEVAVDAKVIDQKSGLSVGSAATAQIRLGAYFTSVKAGFLDVVFDNVVADHE